MEYLKGQTTEAESIDIISEPVNQNHYIGRDLANHYYNRTNGIVSFDSELNQRFHEV